MCPQPGLRASWVAPTALSASLPPGGLACLAAAQKPCLLACLPPGLQEAHHPNISIICEKLT